MKIEAGRYLIKNFREVIEMKVLDEGPIRIISDTKEELIVCNWPLFGANLITETGWAINQGARHGN